MASTATGKADPAKPATPSETLARAQAVIDAAAEVTQIDPYETLAQMRATIDKMDAMKLRLGDAVDLAAIRLAIEMGGTKDMLTTKFGMERLEALGRRNKARMAEEAAKAGASDLVAAPPRELALPSLDLAGVAAHLKGGGVRNVVVLCGAGISVSAGIPDFRSPGCGLYDTLKAAGLPNPESVFTLDYFKEEPAPFYKLAAEMWPQPGRYAPTPTHCFLRLLHEKGVLRRVLTQNIDGLEGLAGLPPDKLVAAHGTFETARCVATGAAVPAEELRAAVMAGREGEHGWEALAERHGGLVKPDVVFFGEQPVFGDSLEEDLPEADLLLVLGTSLLVQPFASLVGLVDEDTPRVLLNNTKVGCADPFLASLGIEQPSHLLNVDSDANTRDVLHLDDCDASVRELCRLAGWDADLARVEALVADAHRRGAAAAPPPVTRPPPAAPLGAASSSRRRSSISPRLSSLDLDGIAAFLASDECRSVAMLTGAGMSSGAGIPDFRSPGGMYDTLRPELITATDEQRALMTADPTAVVQRGLFFETALPYLEVRRPFILGTQEQRWKATLSHRFAELLHAKGKLARLYTQNIDGLDYQCASLPPQKIVPVHGSIGRVACEACGREAEHAAFCDAVRSNIKDIYGHDAAAPAASTPIACAHCGKNAVKPTTVLFGSSLPQEFFTRSEEDLPKADLLIVAGTSLQVAPANGVPGRVPEECVRLVVNREPVGAALPARALRYGERATRDVFAAGECDEVFAELARRLGWLDELRQFEDEMPEGSRAALRAALARATEEERQPAPAPAPAAPRGGAATARAAMRGENRLPPNKPTRPAAAAAATSATERKAPTAAARKVQHASSAKPAAAARAGSTRGMGGKVR